MDGETGNIWERKKMEFLGKYLYLIPIRQNTYEIHCCDFTFKDSTSSNSEISFVELAFVEKEVKWQ